jgi:hypothetical protein
MTNMNAEKSKLNPLDLLILNFDLSKGPFKVEQVFHQTLLVLQMGFLFS